MAQHQVADQVQGGGSVTHRFIQMTSLAIGHIWATEARPPSLQHPFVMMGDMDDFESEPDAFAIECATCVATGTTACADCVVTHLLANDDGPIDLVSVAVASPLSTLDRAIALFERAGLLDDPVQFVDPAEFERSLTPHVVAVP